jgi:hypothetical protein
MRERREDVLSTSTNIVHVLLSLYGVYLQSYCDLFLKVIGICIIYQHLVYPYFVVPRIPKEVLIIGALIGTVLGFVYGDKMLSMPLLYSFLSKVPTYAVTGSDQVRVILAVVFIQVLVDCFMDKSRKLGKDKRLSSG